MAGDVQIRLVRTPDEYDACIAIQRDTWGENFRELVPLAILMAAQRVGGIVGGAFDATQRLVGFVFGISGVRDGRLVHWSDMLAVNREWRNRGIGERLKWFQRDQLLERGVETVFWTFDPLESKNAYLNLHRLGAVAGEYLPNLYGDTDSPLHRGIGTDRLLVQWPIAGERVRRRSEGEKPRSALPDDASPPLVNPPLSDVPNAACADPRLDLDQSFLRVAIPSSIQAVKEESLSLAVDWRAKTRLALRTYMERDYEVVDYVREGEGGSYLLARDDSRH